MNTIERRSKAEPSQTLRPAARIPIPDQIPPRLVNGVLAVVLASMLLASRWTDLDALVTADEPFWISRSANFYHALANGDFERTYQDVHPGVTTMWLGAISFRFSDPDVSSRMGGPVPAHLVRERVTRPGQLPIDTLVDLRKAVVIANVAILLSIFCCLATMLGSWTAFASVAFLGMDPLQIGFSRLLPLDGLSANLLILAVVAFCMYLSHRSRSGLVVSGVVTALALLTRSVNGVLAPLLAMLIIVELAGSIRTGELWRRDVPRYLRAFIVWTGIAFVAAVAFWPALWVEPIQSVGNVISEGSDLAAAPHQRRVLFRGEIISSDPGPIYYPVVLAYRMSPVTLVALLVAAVGLLAPWNVAPTPTRRLCLNLALFAGAYIAILSLASKKLDRYLLPALAALDLIAVIGALLLVGWLAARLLRPSAQVAAILIAGVILLVGQAWVARQSAPYFISYVSPLVGGEAAAREEFSLQWGEGGRAVAEAILQHPEMSAGTVTGGAWPDSIDYYLPFEIKEATYELTPAGAAWFMNSHFLVVTEPEIQRQFYDPSMIAWFESIEPVVTVRDKGRVYARIFDISDMPVPDPYYLPDAPIFEWNKQIRLVGSTFRPKLEVGADLRVRLFFETSGGPFYYWIEAEVVDLDGNVVGEIRKRLRTDETTAGQVTSIFDVELPQALQPGEYRLQMSIRDHDSGELIKAVRVVTGKNANSPVTVGSFTVVAESAADEPDSELALGSARENSVQSANKSRAFGSRS